MAVNISLVGNVGKDPETKTFTNGNTLTTFSVGVSQGYYDQSNQWVDQGTMWVDVKCITPQAKAQLPWVAKGAKVHVTGLLSQRFFTRKDGTQGSGLEVAAQALSFLHKRDEQAPQQGGYGAGFAPAQGYAPAAPAAPAQGGYAAPATDPWSADATAPDF